MTVKQLLATAEGRPIRSQYQPKAKLIDELRLMDERRAKGEPEGHFDHSMWRMQRSLQEIRDEGHQEAIEAVVLRVKALLGVPDQDPAYYEGVRNALAEVKNGSAPDEDEWDRHIDYLESVLESLSYAGWYVPDEFEADFDRVAGPQLYADLTRTCMVIALEYDVWERELRLHPYENENAGRLSMLEDTVTIALSGNSEIDAEAVKRQVGALGLLDPTRLQAGAESEVSTGALLTDLFVEEVISAAVDFRGIPWSQFSAEIAADKTLSMYLDTVVRDFAFGVVPDLVLSSVALGIALWCWRNETAVEAHHLPTDVLMARVNIAVTKVAMSHIDLYEGIDWEGLENALTSPEWALPDGRRITELFESGWPEVERTVREEIRAWRRIEEDLIGPHATMRLLSLGGATSYTWQWWGQGRWRAICEQIVTEAVVAGVPLPEPYGLSGAEAFLRDLEDPDKLDDTSLEWLIEMPGGGLDGPRGLQINVATRPIVREFELWEFHPAEELQA